MLTQDDINFLNWISRRLVNRYNEDPKIILIMDDIINKITCETSSFKELTTITYNSILTSINNLNKIIDHINSQKTTIQDKIRTQSIERNVSTFENINISEVLK